MKVLSIDLDFISEPAINHNRIDELAAEEDYDMWPVIKWQQLFEDHPNEFSHNINLEHYHFCLRTYIRAILNCHDVYFGYDHDNILYGLEGHDNLDIINIDHHDDVFSGVFRVSEHDGVANSKNEIKILRSYNRVMEGNWVMWLQTQGRLNSYTWIGDPNSENVDHIPFATEHLNKFKYATREDYEFDDYKFDQIFVCLSPGYIPPLQWHMMGTFMTIYEELTGKKVDLKSLHKKYEMEYYYSDVTNFISKGTGIGEGQSSIRNIY